MSKSIQRIRHCHRRAFDRYSSILSFEDIQIHIPALITQGHYRDLSYSDYPKHKRSGNCLYGVVEYKNKDFVFVLDKLRNELRTFLPHTFNMGYFGELFSDAEEDRLKYMLSQVFLQMQVELKRPPTDQEVSQEMGLDIEIVKSLSPNN